MGIKRFLFTTPVVLFFILSTLLFCTSYAFPQPAADQVSITHISGEVLTLKVNTTEWQPANAGDLLAEGDSIKTLEGSSAKLQFPSGARIFLKEKTTIAIKRVENEGLTGVKATEIFLPKGKIKAIIEKLDKNSTFEVKTPTSVSGVRGTIFYLNVVKESERLLTGSKKSRIISAMDLLLGVTPCYAEDGNVFTEIFVAEGVVNFLNFISNFAHDIGENQGSFADNMGNIIPPQAIPPEMQEQWTAGFDFATQGSGSNTDGTKKGGSSTTTTGTGGTGDTGGGGDDDDDDGSDDDGTNDDQNDNNSSTTDSDGDGVMDDEDAFPDDPYEWQDTDGDGIGDNADTDDDNDGVPDNEDAFPLDPTRWSTDTDVNIHPKFDETYLKEELLDLYNDVNGILEDIELAALDGRLAEIEDAQAGKTMKDIHGKIVRHASYVLRPTSNKVAILHLSHRRSGEHLGVSSVALEATFNRSLDGADLKNDIPWTDIMTADAHDSPITYSSQPDYYIKPNTTPDFNPTTDQAGLVLTMRNPHGDYNRIYEGFDTLTEIGGRSSSWQQACVTPEYNMNLNGTLKNIDFTGSLPSSSGWVGSNGTGGLWQESGEVYYGMIGSVIDDYGDLQDADYGVSQDLSITSIRNIFAPNREYNLELFIQATEFGERSIDVIVAPEIMRPYYDNGASEILTTTLED